MKRRRLSKHDPIAGAGLGAALDGLDPSDLEAATCPSGNKTSSDHLASMMSKKDCSFVRVFRNTDVCKDRDEAKDPYAVDYDEPQRMVSEDGTSYGPPLRASADAPATSWEAASYKTAPASPPQLPAEAVTSFADAAPAKATAAPAATPKPKKSKSVRAAAKKPSRGPAAPAS